MIYLIFFQCIFRRNLITSQYLLNSIDHEKSTQNLNRFRSIFNSIFLIWCFINFTFKLFEIGQIPNNKFKHFPPTKTGHYILTLDCLHLVGDSFPYQLVLLRLDLILVRFKVLSKFPIFEMDLYRLQTLLVKSKQIIFL